MTRIEHMAEDVTLIQGDAREFTRHVQADAIITDPVWPNVPAGMLAGSEDPEGLLRDVLERARARRVTIVMRRDSDPRILRAVPSQLPFTCAAVLDYVAPGYLGRVLGGMEIVYSYGPPIKSAPGRRVIPGYGPSAQPGGTNREHPCARNDDHMAWAVEWFSDPGEVVLDPFMGSGTTGVACLKIGRPFVGIEIEPKFFDLARRRIDAALRTPQLFRGKVEPPKQEALL